MIASIRKRHKAFWISISVSLPLLFALALINTPERLPEKKEEISASLVGETEFFNVFLDNEKLILEPTGALKSAFATIYLNNEFVGTVGSQSIQSFNVKNPKGGQLTIFDEVEHREILKIKL